MAMMRYCSMCGEDLAPGFTIRVASAGMPSGVVCSTSCERDYHRMAEEERRRLDPLGEAFADQLRALGATIVDVTGVVDGGGE